MAWTEPLKKTAHFHSSPLYPFKHLQETDSCPSPNPATQTGPKARLYYNSNLFKINDWGTIEVSRKVFLEGKNLRKL